MDTFENAETAFVTIESNMREANQANASTPGATKTNDDNRRIGVADPFYLRFDYDEIYCY